MALSRPARRPARGASAPPLLALFLALLCLGLMALAPAPAAAQQCNRVITADVVALDQVYFWNRYGAVQPHGMMYALERDVLHESDSLKEICDRGSKMALSPGKVKLRPDKRPRPMVLRVNVGDCLNIHFTNLLGTTKADDEQPATRDAGVHVVGMQYRQSPTDGGMHIGNDPSGLVAPGGSITYRLYAEKEGTFLMYSGGALVGGEGDNGSIAAGLFGAVNVQPEDSRYFRSQVTRKDLELSYLPTYQPSLDPFPDIDYTARYPTSTDPEICWKAGDPILEMTDGSEIVHTDLTSIVTGPSLFSFPNFPYPLNDPTYPHRNEPYREFTILFHDEIGAVQAFPHFEDEILSHTMHSVRDAFAINYGTGGIGAEILANRLGVGPVHECVDCKYEEFFLASWAVGDPAMIVDKPANFPCGQTSSDWDNLKDGVHTNCNPQRGPKATKAFYPDDPSNVYHSYMNDHVKFRNLLAGSDDHHIFHLHAHQWLHTAKSDTSSYMDSQAIGQGGSFTYEIAYEGSGNRNKTVGDSIFHCHFYPHFAQGMWALWRVHDVLEIGTELDDAGRPVHDVFESFPPQYVTRTRALPDGEIQTGTPIPAIVPLPGKALPPPPTPVQLRNGQIDQAFVYNEASAAQNSGSPYYNPGYPFFIPGQAGHRAPHPPLDFALDNSGNPRDGGLPRHVVLTNPNQDAASTESRLDFHKEILALDALQLPEAGTKLEQLAMEVHATAGFTTPSAGGPPATRPFELNGAKPQPGAPYADPCIDDAGNPISDNKTRLYQAVDIELDVILNKAGWHFPQQRIISLLSDVPATLAGTKAPEPLFFRANSKDCIQFELTNLVPFEWQTDDFQVRTPTDILGQHIHLVKFDVTSSDGGGNGFNYEDGTFSPEEVQERIKAIRDLNQCDLNGIGVQTTHPTTGRLYCPRAVTDPRFGNGPDRNCNDFPDYLGAQTTVQRWWADPVEDAAGNDRTLRTVFTHDHFGPSTHQQAGLYAGLVVEPEGSVWYHNETNTQLGTNPDGSPTSWQARIVPPDQNKAYREFMIEFADFQLAYERNEVWKGCPDDLTGWADPAAAINPPGRKSPGPPFLYLKPDVCPTNDNDPDSTLLTDSAWSSPSTIGETLADNFRAPCPEAVSADDPGFVSVNYRNEPLALRLSSDPVLGPSPPVQVAGTPGDPSFAYESRTDRANPEFNKVPDSSLSYVPYPALTGGLERGDPFTPMLRAYEGDPVQIRVLVGAHEEEHNFTVHGSKWLFEPFDTNSGYRNSQAMGISEWFDFLIPPLPNVLEANEQVDLLYKPSSAAEWQWNGAWGLIRVYQDASFTTREDYLPPLPSNTDGFAVDPATKDTTFREVPESDVTVRSTDDVTDSIVTTKVSCPSSNYKPRPYDITAVAAYEALPAHPTVGRSLVYNRRPDTVDQWDEASGTFVGTESGPLHDPTAILFVYTSDLDYSSGRPRLRPGTPVEPLILRAAADECIVVTLRNDLPNRLSGRAVDLQGWSGWHMIIEKFNANQVRPSQEVGLHPQLVYYDPTRSGGDNVGLNPSLHGKQTVAPGEKITYYWYAGDVRPGSPVQAIPIEFGATGLTSSDPLEHSQKGAVGALIIEPEAASWTFPQRQPYLADASEALNPRLTRAVADVSSPAGSFRELVTVFQDDINLRYAGPNPFGVRDEVVPPPPVQNHVVNEDPTESGQKAFNYRTEPIWFRMGYSPNTSTGFTRDQQFANVLTDAKVGGRPVTQIFRADLGQDVRFRVVHPAGHTQMHVFEVQGHLWPELPYQSDSRVIGQRAASEHQGARMGVGASAHYDIVPTQGAGGIGGVAAEYLYRDYVHWSFDGGIWGLFIVGLP